MIDYILGFQFNSLFGILLYWVPLSMCVVGYTLRTARNYISDNESRERADKSGGHYCPTDTVGILIGRGLASIIPVVNLWAGLFDVAPDFFRRFFKFIGDLFDIPLVPKRKNK